MDENCEGTRVNQLIVLEYNENNSIAICRASTTVSALAQGPLRASVLTLNPTLVPEIHYTVILVMLCIAVIIVYHISNTVLY